jgi:hypothetical protein
MAELDHVQSLILNAIKQKNPSIQPGETFDWLIVSSKLRHSVTTEEFTDAMRALGAADMIGADDTKRHFVITQKGHEAMASDALTVAEKAA